MAGRRAARRTALFLLYQWDLTKQPLASLYEGEADEFARNILFDLAHAIGRSDAVSLHARTGLTDPIARMSAGPVLFAHAGWASVEWGPLRLFGWPGAVLRRLADLVAYIDIESIPKAVSVWLQDSRRQDPR